MEQHASHNQPICLFVGLGNPGSQYVNARHNAGHWFIHALANEVAVSLSSDRKLKGHTANAHFAQQSCRLFIPNSYMNCCGQLIRNTMEFYRIEPNATCIVHDELDLPVGAVRLKYSGGHGGHNGLRDIIQVLQTQDFHRLRIGIGHPGDARAVSNFVLAAPTVDEKKQITRAIDQTIGIVVDLVSGDIDKAMRLLHVRKV